MTKSAKRKKEKSADFTKPRLKLGKGKQPATNAVDTTFKARSIALPQQSITVDKGASEPTTRRKLTLEDLLAHLKHYSVGVRKDALHGLHELLEEHRDLMEPNLLKLVNACARLISDEDAGVRKALHSFLAWFLHRVPRENLAPHASTLLLFTTSAQTHIFPEIRIDAIRILDLLLEFIPEQVVNGSLGTDSGSALAVHGSKVLDGYLGLLNVGVRFGEGGEGSASTSQAVSSGTVMLSSASKAAVLKSFTNFLLHATTKISRGDTLDHLEPDAPIPLWYFSSSFSSPETFISFTNALHLHHSAQIADCDLYLWRSGTDFNDDEGDFSGSFEHINHFGNVGEMERFQDLERVIADIERVVDTSNSPDDNSPSGARMIGSLCRAVHPILISTLLDCAPSVFSPSQASPEAELELVLSILETSRCLYGRLLRDENTALDQKQSVHADLRTLLTHMAAYFPFGENRMIEADTKTDNTFQRMNLIYCELFSLLSLISDSEDVDLPSAKRRKLQSKGRHTAVAKPSIASSEKQTARAHEYVVRCLHGSTSIVGAHTAGQVLTAQTYIALLPTVWWMLGRPVDGEGVFVETLSAVLHHATKAGSTSGVKMSATEFVARLVLLQTEPSYHGAFRIGPTSPEKLQTAARDWLLHLPKALWELGDKHPALSELILLFFNRIFQRRLWLNHAKVLSALRTRFVPFFTIHHATRGELHGPFAKLESRAGPSKPTGSPSTLKRLALDVASVLISSDLSPVTHDPSMHRTRRSERAGTASGNDRETDEVETKEALKRAVEKAVLGTEEEAYWRGVTGM